MALIPPSESFAYLWGGDYRFKTVRDSNIDSRFACKPVEAICIVWFICRKVKIPSCYSNK